MLSSAEEGLGSSLFLVECFFYFKLDFFHVEVAGFLRSLVLQVLVGHGAVRLLNFWQVVILIKLTGIGVHLRLQACLPDAACVMLH